MKPPSAVLAASLLALFACAPSGDPELQFRASNVFGRIEAHLLPAAPRAEAVELGRALFWDPVLSGARDVACASCHHPDHGYAEHLDLSRGVGAVGLSESRRGGQLVKRNSMGLLNVALNGVTDSFVPLDEAAAPMFWDNRETSLEDQALRPLHAFEEMRGDAYAEYETIRSVTRRLRDIPEYVRLFEAAFPGEGITASTMERAIASFERTLLALDSPFDHYLDGDLAALDSEQERGLEAFLDADCQGCHRGPLLSDFALHTNGVPDNTKLAESDRGDGRFGFRTPALRNVALTAPYMHSGVLDDLEDVVAFYHDVNERGGVAGSPVSPDQLDRNLARTRVPRGDADVIAAFLNALTDDGFDRSVPSRVPSGLPPGGAID